MSAATAERPRVKRATVRRSSEFDSRSIELKQPETTLIPGLGEAINRVSDVIPVEQMPKEHQLDELKFAEDPVRILIHRSGEKNPPMTTDLIAINGIKAEMLFKNGWIQIGYLPRGHAFYTKRKYVEQIAHTKSVSVTTRVVEHLNEETGPARYSNHIEKNPSAVFPFSVLEDKSPRAGEWIEKLMLQHG